MLLVLPACKNAVQTQPEEEKTADVGIWMRCL